MIRSYPDHPIPGVGVVILGPDGVLLIKRSTPPRKGCWSLPGGAQEIGETVREAAIREVKEETGLDIRILGLIDVVDSISRDDENGTRFHYTLVDFAACVTGGQIAAGDDALDVQWVSLEQASRMEMWSETHRIIDKADERFGPLVSQRAINVRGTTR